ncbi:MAG: serine hydrolase [Mesorhizobium sp.]
MFYDETAHARALGENLKAWSLDRFGVEGLDADRMALTLVPLDAPLTSHASGQPAGYSHNGTKSFYPCSVVKAFYLAAVEARLEEGAVKPHAELERAMHDMIAWSSNTATNYIIDLVTGTTGDTLLDDTEMREWVERRNWVNRYLQGLGWPELQGINVSQKLMDDDRYGRERMFVQLGGNNHNSLTTLAAARLFHDIFAGRVVTPARSRQMAELLHRPLDPAFATLPAAQVEGYFGAGLPAGAKIWSKAGHTGWTGDATASYRRHDAAYVELPNSKAFILVVFTEGQALSENLSMLPAFAGHAAALLS